MVGRKSRRFPQPFDAPWWRAYRPQCAASVETRPVKIRSACCDQRVRARKLQQNLRILTRVVGVMDLYALQSKASQIRYGVNSCWPGVSRVCQDRDTTSFDDDLDCLLWFQLQAREVGRSVAAYEALEGLLESLDVVAIQ
jgi:hypothetical protein